MTHYFCIVEGMADCTPNAQSYHSCDSAEEFAEIVKAACEEFERVDSEVYFWNSDDRAAVGPAGHLPIRYAFRVPRDGENNYSQRVCISRFYDTVLDVIGMTESEFERGYLF